MFKILALLYEELQKLTWHEYAVVSLFVLWSALTTFYTLYLAAINVWDNRTQVSWWVVAISTPLLATMVVFDTIMNWTIFTVITLDLPREAFVTTRLKRYRAQFTNNWRKSFATFICTKILNPFDPTKHHC